MTEKPVKFTQKEIEHQQVLATESWDVVLPKSPISQFHLMLIIKDRAKHTFDELDEATLSEMRVIIAMLHTKIAQSHKTYDGYNLFSNNGTARIGQHVESFHQHIFLRFTDEIESPYDTLNRGSRWTDDTSEEWIVQRNTLREILDENK